MTVEIQLTQGQCTIVDDIDGDLAELKWYADFRPSYANGGHFTAQRNLPVVNGKGGGTELMHRTILSRILGRPLLRKERVDHEDLNPLNNCRDNLRLATPSQNAMNRCKRSDSTSPYKGVSWHARTNQWRAKIMVSNKQIHLGLFPTPEEAFEAYKTAAIKFFGEFARFE